MYANYHTHTPRCNHAVGNEREYIETAIKSGIKILGFSDHAPMPFPHGYYSDFRMRPEQAEDYVKTLRNLRNEYRADIVIYIGYEAEYYPDIFDRFIEFISQYECDYLILGQHFLGNEEKDVYSGAPTLRERDICRYVDQVCEGIDTGKFTYIAHPDLINFRGEENIYRRETERLCGYAALKNIPLEINFLGIMDGRHYPNPLFWDIAKECGCKAIFGCDAHSPKDVPDRETLIYAERFAEEKKLEVIDKAELISPVS